MELYNSLLAEGFRAPRCPRGNCQYFAAKLSSHSGVEWELLLEQQDCGNGGCGPLTALRIKPEWARGSVDLLPLSLNGLVGSDKGSSSSWSYVGMDDETGSASERSEGKGIQFHPIPAMGITASPEMHDTGNLPAT